jgi:hypothetical protein
LQDYFERELAGMLDWVKPMRPFRRKKYRMRVAGDRVFVTWLKPVTEWSDSECQAYLGRLGKAVRQTVSSEVWSLLTMPEPCENREYQRYVQSVREELIGEYGLNKVSDEVKIGLYHADMLVISFPVEEGVEYPYYYRGIQLKPFKPAAAE